MRCEVCGQEIRGEPRRRIIEGAKMIVCGRCAQFGSEEWSPQQSRTPQRRPTRRTSPRPRRNYVEEAEEMVLVENYGAKIRKARQKAGFTVEDLARKINEKESVIKKLEREDFTPTPRVREKLKRTLSIKLMERVESVSGPVLSGPRGPLTLGDMIKIKETKEKEED